LLESLPPDEPVIVAGDINDWRLKANARLSGYLVEAVGKPTRSFSAHLPMLRLDRIYLRNAHDKIGQPLRHALIDAAGRGVRVEVTLILQGQPDMRWVRALSRRLYNYLLRDHVRIHEYCQRPLHGKVALADNDWSTVGLTSGSNWHHGEIGSLAGNVSSSALSTLDSFV